MLGNIIVLLIIGVVIGLAVRSLWKNHKNGGGCSCGCDGCGCDCSSARPKDE